MANPSAYALPGLRACVRTGMPLLARARAPWALRRIRASRRRCSRDFVHVTLLDSDIVSCLILDAFPHVDAPILRARAVAPHSAGLAYSTPTESRYGDWQPGKQLMPAYYTPQSVFNVQAAPAGYGVVQGQAQVAVQGQAQVAVQGQVQGAAVVQAQPVKQVQLEPPRGREMASRPPACPLGPISSNSPCGGLLLLPRHSPLVPPSEQPV